MSVREGNVNNIPKDQLQTEAIKVFLLFDLIFLIVMFAFVFLYMQLTPFSKAFLGAFCFISIFVVNIICFLLLWNFGRKYEGNIFSEHDYFSHSYRCGNSDISKASEGNNIILYICFVIVWTGTLFYAPDNIYYTEFKPNIISWLDQGKCNEIKKYDDKIASFCSVMLEAKNNTKGSFVVLNKNLTAGATGCIYMLQSNNNGASVVTTKPQTCDLTLNQKVFIEVHSFITYYDRGNGDGYSYSLEAVL